MTKTELPFLQLRSVRLPQVQILTKLYQEKMTGLRGRLRALAGICHVHESYFKPSGISILWRKSVFRDVRMQS